MPESGDPRQALTSLTRAHRQLAGTWHHHAKLLRDSLREFYPGALLAFTDPASPEARAVLSRAHTPREGRALSRRQIAEAVLRKTGLECTSIRARAIQAALRSDRRGMSRAADGLGPSVRTLVNILDKLADQIHRVEQKASRVLESHPDAKLG